MSERWIFLAFFFPSAGRPPEAPDSFFLAGNAFGQAGRRFSFVRVGVRGFRFCGFCLFGSSLRSHRNCRLRDQVVGTSVRFWEIRIFRSSDRRLACVIFREGALRPAVFRSGDRFLIVFLFRSGGRFLIVFSFRSGDRFLIVSLFRNRSSSLRDGILRDGAGFFRSVISRNGAGRLFGFHRCRRPEHADIYREEKGGGHPE